MNKKKRIRGRGFYAYKGNSARSLLFDVTAKMKNLLLSPLFCLFIVAITGCSNTLPKTIQSVDSLAWSPDSQTLAIGSNSELYLFTDTFQELGHIGNSGIGAITSISWSPDNQVIAITGSYGTLRIWHFQANRIQDLANNAYAVTWSPDGSRLANAHDKDIQIWDTRNFSLQTTLLGHTDTVYSTAWSTDGSMLASGSADGTIRVWDLPATALLQTFQTPSGLVTSVAWNPVNNIIAAADEEGINLWNYETGENQLLSLDTGFTYQAFSMSWSADGRYIIVALGLELELWDTTTGQSSTIFETRDFTIDLVDWSPDSTKFAIGSTNGVIQIWDADTNQLLSEFK